MVLQSACAATFRPPEVEREVLYGRSRLYAVPVVAALTDSLSVTAARLYDFPNLQCFPAL